jgi:large subunit ribosomal protein L3
MTRIYNDTEVVPVTVAQAGPCKIVEILNYQNNKFSAQICFGERKNRNVPKPLLGHLKKHGITQAPEVIKEVPIDNPQEHKVGDEITSSIFVLNELVDVQGITKGHGFSGVVKRWDFGGGPRTHGQSDRLRHPGAIGSQRPQRVIKGMKMAGHYGVETVTVKNLQIVKIDNEKNLVFIKGAVPGPKNSVFVIKKTGKIKEIKKVAEEKKDKKTKK